MPPRVQNASPKTAKSKAGSAASSPQSDPPQQSSKQKKKGTTAKGNDLTVTQKVSREVFAVILLFYLTRTHSNPNDSCGVKLDFSVCVCVCIWMCMCAQERAAWWESCNGQCVVCGMRFQHPLRDKLRPYSDIDTLLFKYNILQKIEMGHLIDNYILDNAKLFAADLPAHAKICQLKPLDLDETQLKDASEKLSVLIQEAKAHMLPVCKDCNSTMTTERTELISALEGSNIDPGWFVGDKMPTTLRKNARDKNSPAKLLQSLVMFFAVNLDTSRQRVQMAVKEKADVWRDACVTKTVSHLMQWGRRRQWRHLALCIFWSAYYVWICFLNEEQQTVMDFGTWYSFVFRPYYQHYFAPGSWFGHDVLVISQVTNPNASMFVFTGDSTAPNWHAWVCKQVETVAAVRAILPLFLCSTRSYY